jgi:uncharacterized membrane protein
MTLPEWYIWTVSVFVAATALLGLLALCLLASAALVDKIMWLLKLHDCFLDFMVQWIRKRHQEKLEP